MSDLLYSNYFNLKQTFISNSEVAVRKKISQSSSTTSLLFVYFEFAFSITIIIVTKLIMLLEENNHDCGVMRWSYYY